MAERVIVFHDCDFCADLGVAEPLAGEPLPAAFGGKMKWVDACTTHRHLYDQLKELWERLGRLGRSAPPEHEPAATAPARHRLRPGGRADPDRDADWRWRCPAACGAGPFNSRSMFRAHLREYHKDIEGQHLMRSLARYACDDCPEILEGHVRWWMHRKKTHGKEGEPLPAKLEDAAAS